MTVLRKSPLTRSVAVVMALALALTGCGDGDDDNGGSGYTGTTVPDQSDDSATTTSANDTDPGY